MPEDARHDRKKAWKAFQVNYEYVFSVSDRLCSYCLTDQEVAALLSVTEYLKWSTRWVRADGDVDPDIILKFTDGMERNLMSGCCEDNLPIQYRYSSTGVLQRSLNGGGSWTDAPEYDPRVYSPQFPPAPGDDGDDKKCIAATGAATLIKEQVGEQLTDDMTRYTLAQLITDWIKTYIGTSNPFQALLTVIANQIFALVIATLRPALTDSVYHTLQCILYCHMADDASFNDSQWQAVREDITSQIGGIAGVFLEHLVYLLGAGGITNVARAGGASSGSCGDCGCGPCPTWNFVSTNGGWTAIDFYSHGDDGTWVSGQGWQDRYDPVGGAYNNRLAIQSPFFDGCTGEKTVFIHMAYSTSFPPENGITDTDIILNGGTPVDTGFIDQSDEPQTDKIISRTFTFTGHDQLQVVGHAVAADWFITKVEIA